MPSPYVSYEDVLQDHGPTIQAVDAREQAVLPRAERISVVQRLQRAQFRRLQSLQPSKTNLTPALRALVYLHNAFGSMPQTYMWQMLRHMGILVEFVQCAEDLYTDAFFMVTTGDGSTEPIRQGKGVYQGCPLSSYLFIAALEPLLLVIKTAQQDGVPLAADVRECVSAYADDLKVFSSTAAGIKTPRDRDAPFAGWDFASTRISVPSWRPTQLVQRRHHFDQYLASTAATSQP